MVDEMGARSGELTAEAHRKGLQLEPRLDGDWDLYRESEGGRTPVALQGAPPGCGLTQEQVAVHLSRTPEPGV